MTPSIAPRTRKYHPPNFADALREGGAFAAVSFLMTLDSLFDERKMVPTEGYLIVCTAVIERTKDVGL